VTTWEAVVEAGVLLAAAGLTPGTTGNISVRVGDRVLVSGTGTRLGRLRPEDGSTLALDGTALGGPRATKESALHLAVYRARPDATAIVHLHSPAALAVSCLAGLADLEPLPSYTPYYAMRVLGLRTVGYHHPGAASLAGEVAEALRDVDAVLLRRHGLVTIGPDLDAALAAAEELEANCDLHLRLAGLDVDPLSTEEIAEVRRSR
jgi:3-dehydro-4-phosphotetronate decarboxylase